MKTFLATFLVFGAGLMTANPALASPADEMCDFVDIISNDGIDAAMEHLNSIADLWGEAQRAKLPVVVGSELGKFKYRGGQVWQIADLPGAVEEFYLTLNLTTNGSVYVRVLYEGNGNGQMHFLNIDFNSEYYDMLTPPFMQTPEKVDCPE